MRRNRKFDVLIRQVSKGAELALLQRGFGRHPRASAWLLLSPLRSLLASRLIKPFPLNTETGHVSERAENAALPRPGHHFGPTRGAPVADLSRAVWYFSHAMATAV